MNPAETLRKAAALMRERAQAATQGAWFAASQTGRKDGVALVGVQHEPRQSQGGDGCIAVLAGSGEAVKDRHGNAAHIASWSPAVALQVAYWLEVTAKDVGTSSLAYHAALSVAHVYLGEQS